MNHANSKMSQAEAVARKDPRSVMRLTVMVNATIEHLKLLELDETNNDTLIVSAIGLTDAYLGQHNLS
jgi:hypothetical protein